MASAGAVPLASGFASGAGRGVSDSCVIPDVQNFWQKQQALHGVLEDVRAFHLRLRKETLTVGRHRRTTRCCAEILSSERGPAVTQAARCHTSVGRSFAWRVRSRVSETMMRNVAQRAGQIKTTNANMAPGGRRRRSVNFMADARCCHFAAALAVPRTVGGNLSHERESRVDLSHRSDIRVRRYGPFPSGR